MSDARPFHKKFHVIRTDNGEYVESDTFTLILETDPWAIPAIIAYADACEGSAPDLARDLRSLARRYGGDDD